MSVGAASVALGPAFAVVAFTLHGRVLDETQQPVAGVCVRVNACLLYTSDAADE